MRAYQPFQKAEAVWAAGLEKEVNLTCIFTARFSALSKGKLKVTASCLYRAFLNGKLISYGPARAAHGYFRVDEIDLTEQKEQNFLLIEVAGYNCNSFYTLNQPSFLRAEVTDGETVVAYTGAPGAGFECSLSGERLQKVARFSYQRGFLESYRFRAPFAGFSQYDARPVATARIGYGRLLPRRVDLPDFAYCAFDHMAHGKFELRSEREKFPRTRYLTNENIVIFPEDEWEIDVCDTAYNFVYRDEEEGAAPSLSAGEYALFCYPRELTGFIETQLYAEEDSLVYVLFDEVDLGEQDGAAPGVNVCFWRNDTLNVITYEIKKGDFAHLSFEAYTAKYIKIVVLKGKVNGLRTGMRCFENTNVAKLQFRCDDEKINVIMAAARQTLAQNSVDALTDCPSRERAAWLCDSYFSGQAEKLFTGENRVERNFLENYALQSDDMGFEDGVLAMCYPADFADGQFIPNWMMFYLLELNGYYERTGDREFLEKVAVRAEKALKYFERFENEFGLLEDLENWVFIEWSMANDKEFIKGVNFPSNMLYAKALECFGKLYGREEYVCKAERIREEIRALSYNGELFEDNLVRQNGNLVRCGHTSETCQYYAFYFGVADKERYPELYRFVFERLGPQRDGRKEYVNVYQSNAFIGNLLRLDYLIEQGCGKQFLDESKEYYYKMAAKTGTLWEHNEIQCSLNHGFASYVGNMVVKCFTGFRGIDEGNKRAYFDEGKTVLPCEIKIPTRSGEYVEISCKDGERFIKLPEGYSLCLQKSPTVSILGNWEMRSERYALAGRE